MPFCAETVPKYAKLSTKTNLEQVNEKISEENEENPVNNQVLNFQDLCCQYCKKIFSSKSTLTRHLKSNCKVKKENDEEKENIFKLLLEKDLQHKEELKNHKEEMEELKKQNKLLMDKIDGIMTKNNEIMKIHKTIKKLETSIPANTNINISNQYLEQIIQKDKVIEKLNKTNNSKIDDLENDELENNESENNESENNELNNMEIENKLMTLILNNDVIECRQSDGYINATQLCKAGGKLFAHWYRLDSTKQLIFELAKKIYYKDYLIIKSNDANDIHIWISQTEPLLINSKKGNSFEFIQGTWIHPDLAIQLAQWISPSFALQVSHWIRTLFVEGKAEVNIKLLKEKENTIKDCKKRIEYLEKQSLKRISRKNSDNKFNVVYLITCDELEANRKYIIGKAKDLLNRLSQYNKMSNYRVIYLKSFKDEMDMELAESIVLHTLEKYKEQMNHDRFILPVDKDLNTFKVAFDNAFKCFEN